MAKKVKMVPASLLKGAIAALEGRDGAGHSYDGGCPEDWSGEYSDRDPDCPACKWLVKAAEALKAK